MNYQERLFRQSQGFGCYPQLIMIAIAAGSAVAQVQSAKANAQAQQNAQTQETAANNAIITANTQAARDQESQSLESSSRDQEKARQAYQKAKATTVTAAGEAGVSGNSVDALLAEHATQFGQFQEADLRQQALIRSGADSQVDNIRLGGAFQNLQINQPIAGPNYAAIATQFAGTAYGMAQDAKWFNQKPTVSAIPTTKATT